MGAFTYTAYGLRLRASAPIPGLLASADSDGADLQIELGSMPRWLSEIPNTAESWYTSADLNEDGESTLTGWKLAGGAYYRLVYSDGTEFLITRSGTQIWAVWPRTATVEDTAAYLLGPVMGFVLRLRGKICLHASSVAIEDRAIALLGVSGAGKSTTAAAFAQMGYRILSDDIVTLSDHENGFSVEPAYPRLRLWPESVSAIYGSSDALPLWTPTWNKRFLSLAEEGRFQVEALPLGAIYILSERREDHRAPLIEPVSAKAALMDLVANTYATNLLDKNMRAREFETLTRLVGNVFLRRVIPHADATRLTRLCDLIQSDFQSLDFRSRTVADASQVELV